MLSKDTFGLEHIRELQKNSGRDPILIERVLYAFGLLEALVRVEMPFIFKGGTCSDAIISTADEAVYRY